MPCAVVPTRHGSCACEVALTWESLWYHCAVLGRRLIRIAAIASAAVMLGAVRAFAQSPSPSSATSIPKAPAPWTFYMAIATIGIAGLTLLAAVLGYVMQAPGFRRGQRPGPAAGGQSESS